MHACMHACIHPYIHTYIHTYILCFALNQTCFGIKGCILFNWVVCKCTCNAILSDCRTNDKKLDRKDNYCQGTMPYCYKMIVKTC